MISDKRQLKRRKRRRKIDGVGDEEWREWRDEVKKTGRGREAQ